MTARLPAALLNQKPNKGQEAFVFFDQADPPAQSRTTVNDTLGLFSWTHSLLILLASLFILRLAAMIFIPLTDTTEARYAEIARKMLETGDWITPQFAYGVPFWGKPPLHTWLSAWGMDIFGVSAFGARSLIFVVSVVLLWIFWRFLLRAVGAETALSIIVILASSGLFFGASGFVMTDMVMTFGITLSMLSYWEHTQFTGRQKTTHGHLVFVGLAIGMLAKGPVAIVLVVIPMMASLFNAAHRAHIIALPWKTGGLLFLVLCGPWYVWAELKTPGFLRYFIIGEHFERFIVPDWQGDLYGNGHERAKGAIWLGWIAAFFPWSFVSVCFLLTPRKVVVAFKEDQSGLLNYFLIWALSPLLLFTFSANILTAYVLPGLPASAALFVMLWQATWANQHHRWTTIGFASVISLPIGFFLILTIGSALAPERLNLRTHKPVIEAARHYDENATIHYLERVPFSAEFYTSGKVQKVTDTKAVSTLIANAQSDILVISRSAYDLQKELLPKELQAQAFVGNMVILSETSLRGAKQ